MDPETVQEYLNTFFESRWTGHVGLGALAWFVAAVIGKLEMLWGPLETTTLIMGALGVAGVSYSIHACLDWVIGDDDA